MFTHFFDGIRFWFAGLNWITRKDLRWFVIIPLTLNLIFWGVMLTMVYRYLNEQIWFAIPGWLPDWMDPISNWIYNFLFGLVFVVLLPVFLTGFTILANIIAAPFNGLLSDLVLNRVDPTRSSPPLTFSFLKDMVIRTLHREFTKLMYYLPRLILVLILMIIPGVNLLAPFIWILFGAWMAAVQYLDFAADNQGLSFEATLAIIRRHWASALSLGLVVITVTLIPILNFVVIPTTVVAATLLWHHRFEQHGLNTA